MIAAAGAGALASAAVCLWFQKSACDEEGDSAETRRRGGAGGDDKARQGGEGMPYDSPVLAPRPPPASSEGGESSAAFDSPDKMALASRQDVEMPSPMRNVRPKTLFGDPAETCSEVPLLLYYP